MLEAITARWFEAEVLAAFWQAVGGKLADRSTRWCGCGPCRATASMRYSLIMGTSGRGDAGVRRVGSGWSDCRYRRPPAMSVAFSGARTWQAQPNR